MAQMQPVPGGFVGTADNHTVLVSDQQMIGASEREAQQVRDQWGDTGSLDEFSAEWDATARPYDTAYWTEQSNGSRR